MWELDSVKSFFSVGYTSSRFTWIIFGVRVRNSRNVRKLFTQRVDKISLFQIVPSDLELSLLTSIPITFASKKWGDSPKGLLFEFVLSFAQGYLVYLFRFQSLVTINLDFFIKQFILFLQEQLHFILK